jgi:hypothetical protein
VVGGTFSGGLLVMIDLGQWNRIKAKTVGKMLRTLFLLCFEKLTLFWALFSPCAPLRYFVIFLLHVDLNCYYLNKPCPISEFKVNKNNIINAMLWSVGIYAGKLTIALVII